MSKIKWIEPQFSKEKVKKAGYSLINLESSEGDLQGAKSIFHNWRSSHAFPMQIMLDLLRKNSIKIDRNAIAVQRLKRGTSIIGKLFREKNMNLSRMEDIAGCRVVVSSARYAYKVFEQLKSSRTNHILHRDRDYIAKPKPSGYRSIHLIYRYNGSRDVYNGMSVELQVRSRIQHSWATAVEVVGAFTKQALKASSGDSDWLDLFRYISAEFAILEGCPVDPRLEEIDTFIEMDRLVEKLELFKRLSAFKVATTELTNEENKGAGYFVILLDMEEKLVYHARFGTRELAAATDFYDEQEDIYKNDPSRDVVLVSAGSLRDLKRAYPNYFADTDEFEKNIKRIYAQL